MGQEESRVIGDDVAPQTLRARSLEAVAELIKDGTAKRIAVLTGAGISTAAGSKSTSYTPYQIVTCCLAATGH
jgi:NAD-dependent histone deacetylase SIR2